MTSAGKTSQLIVGLTFFLLIAPHAFCQTPSPALLVIEKDTRQVAVIDPASLKIIGHVPVGADPHEICVSSDGKTAYISDYGAFGTPLHTLSVIDLVAQKPLPPVELGALLAPHGMQTAGEKIYFTAEGSKAIGRYDPAGKQVDWILGLGENRTHMLVVSQDQNHIFASDVNSNEISILDRDSDREKADASGWNQTRIPVGKGPEGFDVSPDGKELWAANSHDGTVSIVDVASRKVVQTLDVHTKRSNRVKFTPNGQMVLISDLDTGDLVVLDSHARHEIKRVSLGHGAAGILIAPDGSRAFVAVSRDNNVAVVDLKTLSVTGHIATGGGPDGMAWAVRK
jgi:YVTN family beta-propeller protein